MDSYVFLLDPANQGELERLRDRQRPNGCAYLALLAMALGASVVTLESVRILNAMTQQEAPVHVLLWAGLMGLLFLAISAGIWLTLIVPARRTLVIGQVLSCDLMIDEQGERLWTLVYQYTSPRRGALIERSVTFPALPNPLGVAPAPGDRVGIVYTDDKTQRVLSSA